MVGLQIIYMYYVTDNIFMWTALYIITFLLHVIVAVFVGWPDQAIIILLLLFLIEFCVVENTIMMWPEHNKCR